MWIGWGYGQAIVVIVLVVVVVVLISANLKTESTSGWRCWLLSWPNLIIER